MSYDVDIYFSQPTPPVAEIETVLSLMDLPVTSHGDLEWSIWIGATVCIGVDGGPSVRTCAPVGTYWYANVSTSLGRTRTAWIAQWAIPYGALLLIEGTSVHDCHIGAHELGVFTTPRTWQEFARTQCPDVDLPFAADRTPWLERVARDQAS